VLADGLKQLQGAPAPLAALHAQAAQLLEGKGYEARLAALKGHPVVVNKWASWCRPCVAEFPIFQRLSTRLGKKIAFLGLNSANNRGDAKRFLAAHPTPYPSYVDENGKIARANGAGENFPTTVFYDRTGKLVFAHQGQYRTEADLVADIERYAR
jgi:cytochrome c biogenesis protein CcmG/thiol:disulfide interchange protein DsbE